MTQQLCIYTTDGKYSVDAQISEFDNRWVWLGRELAAADQTGEVVHKFVPVSDAEQADLLEKEANLIRLFQRRITRRGVSTTYVDRGIPELMDWVCNDEPGDTRRRRGKRTYRLPSDGMLGPADTYMRLTTRALGPTLRHLQRFCGGTVEERSALRIALQGLDILESLASKRIIHRDLKLDNFVMGLDEMCDTLTCIDFGLATTFEPGARYTRTVIDPDTGTASEEVYVDNRATTRSRARGRARMSSFHYGTPYTASGTTHLALEHGYWDDVEAWGYTIIEFCAGCLPWSELSALDAPSLSGHDEDPKAKEKRTVAWAHKTLYAAKRGEDRESVTGDLQESRRHDNICEAMKQYLRLVRQHNEGDGDWQAVPCYTALRDIFRHALDQTQAPEEEGMEQYEWINTYFAIWRKHQLDQLDE